jgi:hypothetical protein
MTRRTIIPPMPFNYFDGYELLNLVGLKNRPGFLSQFHEKLENEVQKIAYLLHPLNRYKLQLMLP